MAVLDLSQTITYRGLMFTDVPNLLQVLAISARVGLRVDLIGDFLVSTIQLHGFT